MKKIISLNVADTNVYDKSALEVSVTALRGYCLKMSRMVAINTTRSIVNYFCVDGALVHCNP